MLRRCAGRVGTRNCESPQEVLIVMEGGFVPPKDGYCWEHGTLLVKQRLALFDEQCGLQILREVL